MVRSSTCLCSTVVAAALAGAIGCVSEPSVPLGTLSPEQAQQLVIQRDDARDALAARDRQLQREIEALKNEISDLHSQLGLAQETAEDAADRAARYEQGLGKAVEKLNEVSQEATTAKVASAAATAVASYRARHPTQQEPSANLSYFTDPHLSIVEDSIMASGRYYNSGNVEAIGTLYLDLVRNGEVMTTGEERIRPIRSWGSWQHEFRFTPARRP